MNYKNFTKSQFSAVTNEMVKLAKEFTNKGFNSSVSFSKTSTTIFIHDDNCCSCLLTIYNKRYFIVREFRELVDVAKRADVTLNGRYTKMMLEEYNNIKYVDENDYIAF